ncbi:hypothetical protein F3Y22_tig00004779pilonHSYRG00077 [Hibiscus syriacus]|uniref:Uncharacterized protein n=1 Tax=Hibiscus syriacus TaxID=106335 RepID=A0A6A3CM26_HIBSY|nr:hypothetical protein F3Y22_tig00004779pilonHSYRG00077 [Hibiscus syriacus]
MEMAREVGSFSEAPIPYDQMKSQCEACVIGKQQKMSVLHNFTHQQAASATSEDIENEILYLPREKAEEDLKLISNDQGHVSGQLALCSQQQARFFQITLVEPLRQVLESSRKWSFQ